MTTQVTRTLPPGYVESFGEDFTAAITGAVDDKGNPLFDLSNAGFYVDPADYMGTAANDYYTSDMDALQKQAQNIATGPGGLGSYADYLTNAEDFATDGEKFFKANQDNYKPFMTAAASGYNKAMTQADLQAGCGCRSERWSKSIWFSGRCFSKC